MSVINRLEAANFLNLDDTADWRPDYRHVVFQFRGQSSAINLPNGGGKSTLSRAMLTLLGRDPTFTSATRRKMAPDAYGVYSHIRLELLLNEDPRGNDLLGRIGQDVPGEPHVFGMFGHSGGIWFYRYQGRLEDCPVGETRDGKVALVDNESFRTRLRGIRGVLHDPEVEEWLREVDRHFDRGAVRQMIDYQKRGAGDGTASFFKVSRLQNEPYDTAFFYSVLAPELLAGVMGAEAEPDEHRFEDTVLKSARTILNTMFESKRKEEEVATIERACQEVEKVHTRARDFTAARAAFDRDVAGLLAEASFLDRIVLEQPLPGIPSAALPDHPQTRAVAARLVLADGTWLLPDWAIGEITGEEPSHVNQRAARKTIARIPVRGGQVVENPCDRGLGSSRAQGGGPSNSGYLLDAALDLIRNAPNIAGSWDREAALRAVNHGFDWAVRSSDTNPMRRKATHLDRELADLGTALAGHERDQEQADAELKRKLASRQTMDAARHAFVKMQTSGLFDAGELAAPADTARAASHIQRDADEALATHKERAAAFARPFEQWQDFVGQDGEDADPQAVVRQIEESHSALQRTAAEAKSLRETLQSRFDCVVRDLHDAERERDTLRARISRMEGLLDGVSRFAILFPGEAPEGLEERLDRRLAKANADHTALTIEQSKALDRVAALEALLPEVARYDTLFPGESPQGLERRCLADLSDAERAVDALTTRIAGLQEQVEGIAAFHHRFGPDADPHTEQRRRRQRQEELSVERARLTAERDDAVRRRADLDQARASAGRIAHEVLLAAGPDAIPLHEVVERLGLEPDRLRQVLTHFSALLFAPVAPDVPSAARIAARLFEQGLEAPVLVAAELAEFCRTGQLVDGREHVHSWVLGIRTRPVDCLLDPAGVEREKERLDALIADLTDRLDVVEHAVAALLPDSPDGLLIDAAIRALEAEAPRRLAEARTELVKAEETLERAQTRASEQARAAIGARIRFDGLGGGAALERDRTRLEEIARELERLGSDIAALQAQTTAGVRDVIRAARDFARDGGPPALEDARARASDIDVTLEDLRSERIELEDRIEEARKAASRADDALDIAALALQRIPILREAARFLTEGGPAFMRSEAENRSRLTEARNRAQQRMGFEFDLAQQHVDHRAAGAEEQLDRAIAHLEERLREIKEVIARGRQHQDVLRNEIGHARTQASKLDASVTAILQQWRAARNAVIGFSATVPAEGGSSPALERAQQCVDAFHAATDEPEAERIERIGDVREAVDAFQIVIRAQQVEQSRKSKDEALRRLVSEVDRVAALDDLGLSDNERLRLAGTRTDPAEADTLYGHLTRQYRENVQLLERIRRNLEERRQQLAGNLGSLSARVTVNYETLRRALAWKTDKESGELVEAGFEVTATLREGEQINSIIEGIIQVIEEEERHRQAEAKRGRPLSSQEEHDQTLKAEIRRAFYRGMFVDPKIRMRHPELKAGKQHPFDDKISTGQQNAVALMLMLKLADFAIERDIRTSTRNPAHRRKARALAQKVVVIDGLFSNLTDRALIRESMAAISRVRGNFQLIGWIHNPLYQNDPDIFPTFIVARRLRNGSAGAGYIQLHDGDAANLAELGRTEGEIGTLAVHVDQRPADLSGDTSR